MKRKKTLFAILTLALMIFFTACGEDQQPNPTEGDVLIYAALNPVTRDLQKSVNTFNESHESVKIEIQDYSDENGVERLLTELVLGKVPDIMEMHYFGKAGPTVASDPISEILPENYTFADDEYWMPYRQMAQKGYLEDLWPYIENDPEFGREGVLQAPLKAAEVNGGLYILFQKVVIFTLTGRESVVGDRYSWTLDELMEVLANMPEGSTILRYNMTRKNVFFNLLRFSLEQYVDRKTGTCSFDSQSFRDLVGFLENFPEEAAYEDPAIVDEEVRLNIKQGQQMLEGMVVEWPQDIVSSDSIWQERAAFPGYPTADGSSGSFFYTNGNILSISSVCQNKDAAWEYIRTLIKPRQSKTRPYSDYMNIPINSHDYEWLLWGEVDQMRKVQNRSTPEEIMERFCSYHFTYGPPVPWLHLLTEDDTQRHKELIDHTTRLYWPDDDLTAIVWEVLGAYFAGDLTLDQTVDRIQNRAGLYVNESM